MVLTSSSGRAGEPPNAPAGFPRPRRPDNSARSPRPTSIARNVGRRAVAHRGVDRVGGDLAVDRSRGEIRVRLLVADRLGGLIGGELHDFDLVGSTPYCRRITLSRLTLAAVLPTTPIAGRQVAAIFVIFGPAFLPLTGCRRHPQHRDVLAQRGHGLRVLRHIEIAADDGEVGLAVAQCLRARRGAVGLRSGAAARGCALRTASASEPP